MAHQNKVVRSVNAPGGLLCVDVFRRADGSFGFEEYRRDPEDGRGWYPVGFYESGVFGTETEAFSAACKMVVWLCQISGPETDNGARMSAPR